MSTTFLAIIVKLGLNDIYSPALLGRGGIEGGGIRNLNILFEVFSNNIN